MITMKDVRAWLDSDEVDYENAKKLGLDAIPFLMELVQGQDVGLASKATYLASMINTEQSAKILEKAAKSNEPVVRIAAASGLGNMPEVQSEKVLELLQNDPDIGIRKVMLKSTERFRSPEVEAKLQKIADTDSEQFIRELAENIVKEMKRKRNLIYEIQ